MSVGLVLSIVSALFHGPCVREHAFIQNPALFLTENSSAFRAKWDEHRNRRPQNDDI